MLSQGFQSQEGATDFLGLDRDLRSTPAAPAVVAKPGESWLLEMKEEAQAEAASPKAEPAKPAEPERDLTPLPPLRASFLEEERPRASMRRQLTKAAAFLVVGMLAMTAYQYFGKSATNGSSDGKPLAPEDNPTPRYGERVALTSTEKPAPRKVAEQAPGTESETPIAESPRDFGDLVESEDAARRHASDVASAATTSAATAQQNESAQGTESTAREPVVAEDETGSDESDASDLSTTSVASEGATASSSSSAVSTPERDVPIESTSSARTAETSSAAAAHASEPSATSVVATLVPQATPLATPLDGKFLELSARLREPSRFSSARRVAAANVPQPSVAEPAPIEPAVETASIPAVAASSPTGAMGPALTDVLESQGAAPGADRLRTTKLKVEDVLLQPGDKSLLHRASAAELSGLWAEKTIPFEAIGSPTKVLTPAVGRVRVILKTNEIFEGALYALGEGCVWIDTQYGRMGLAGTRVQNLVQIDTPPGTPALGAPGSQNLVGLERVRIKTPGGVFFGKLVSRDSLKTTVVTDDGARITLDTKDVELLVDTPKIAIKP